MKAITPTNAEPETLGPDDVAPPAPPAPPAKRKKAPAVDEFLTPLVAYLQLAPEIGAISIAEALESALNGVITDAGLAALQRRIEADSRFQLCGVPGDQWVAMAEALDPAANPAAPAPTASEKKTKIKHEKILDPLAERLSNGRAMVGIRDACALLYDGKWDQAKEEVVVRMAREDARFTVFILAGSYKVSLARAVATAPEGEFPPEAVAAAEQGTDAPHADDPAPAPQAERVNTALQESEPAYVERLQASSETQTTQEPAPPAAAADQVKSLGEVLADSQAAAATPAAAPVEQLAPPAKPLELTAIDRLRFELGAHHAYKRGLERLVRSLNGLQSQAAQLSAEFQEKNKEIKAQVKLIAEYSMGQVDLQQQIPGMKGPAHEVDGSEDPENGFDVGDAPATPVTTTPVTTTPVTTTMDAVTPDNRIQAGTNDARAHGASAAKAGQPITACPFKDALTPVYVLQWLDGYRCALSGIKPYEADTVELTAKMLGAALLTAHGVLQPADKPQKVATVELFERHHLVLDAVPGTGAEAWKTSWHLAPLFSCDEWRQLFQEKYGREVEDFDQNDEARSTRQRGGLDCGRMVKHGRSKLVVGPQDLLVVVTTGQKPAEVAPVATPAAAEAPAADQQEPTSSEPHDGKALAAGE